MLPKSATGLQIEQKDMTHPFAVYKRLIEPKDTSRLKVKGWKTIFHAKGPQKKAGVAIPISDRLDFKLKTVVRDTEGH